MATKDQQSDISPLNQLIRRYRTGYSLPQIAYNNEEIYDAEMEKIFRAHWLFAGHASQIPEPGNFFLFEFDRESIIIVRTKDGTIKAHANVCRHRGSRICLEQQGKRKLFTCPYHAWSFDLDGKLVSARMMADDFNVEDNNLHPVKLENISGLLFINISQDAPNLIPMKENLSEIFETFDFKNLKIAAHKTYDIPANWKLALENYQECYHCLPSHPEFAKIHVMALAQEELQEKREAFLKKNTSVIAQTEFNHYFDHALPGEECYQYSRNPLYEGIESGTKDGKAAAPLLGKVQLYDGGASELMIGPVNFFLIYSDHMLCYRFMPISRDECKCDVFWFTRNDAVEGRDYELENLTWLWDVTTAADKDIISNNKKGVDSTFYTPGRLSKMEFFEQSFLNWYIAKLSD